MSNIKKLTNKQRKELIGVVKTCFEKNMARYKNLEWPKIQTKLESNSPKLWELNEMKQSEMNLM